MHSSIRQRATESGARQPWSVCRVPSARDRSCRRRGEYATIHASQPTSGCKLCFSSRLWKVLWARISVPPCDTIAAAKCPPRARMTAHLRATAKLCINCNVRPGLVYTRLRYHMNERASETSRHRGLTHFPPEALSFFSRDKAPSESARPHAESAFSSEGEMSAERL